MKGAGQGEKFSSEESQYLDPYAVSRVFVRRWTNVCALSTLLRAGCSSRDGGAQRGHGGVRFWYGRAMTVPINGCNCRPPLALANHSLFPHLGIRATQPLRGLIRIDTISQLAPLRVGEHPWIWFPRERELVELVSLETAVRGNLSYMKRLDD